jgi:hypothetical protein
MLPRAIKPKIDIPFCTLFLCGQTDIATMKVNESGAFLKLFLVDGSRKPVPLDGPGGFRQGSIGECWIKFPYSLILIISALVFVHWPEF